MKTELELFCWHPIFAKLHETLRPIRLTLLYVYLHVIREALSRSFGSLHVEIFQIEIIHYWAISLRAERHFWTKLYFSALEAMFYSCLKRFQHKTCVDIILQGFVHGFV